MKSKNIKLLYSVALVFILSVSMYAQTNVSELNLMPMPANIKLGNGEYIIDSSFTVSINKDYEKLFKASKRAVDKITEKTGLFLDTQFPIVNGTSQVGLIINVNKDVEVILGINESYKLEITEKNISIISETTIGAIHGLSTLIQLLDSNEEGYFFPCVSIDDNPRFEWRGLLIDVSRHFEPIDVIKRNLDGMAAVKMNVLHWHLTDDHGFRIECKALPKLHELGSDGLYYTQQEIKDIINYAADRGIRVVPEFDLPGHATSWLVGYPELASAPGPYTIERNWGIFNPTMDPTNEKVYEFLEIFFKEMSTLFPDQYWHIGGDENNGRQWDANQKIQEFMTKNNLKDNHALQNYFNIRIDKTLSRINKTMVGWYTDEMPDLSKDYIVQAWKGRKTLYETAKNGYRSLLSHGFYIDLVQSTEYHYINDPIPPDSILTDEVKKRIIGGEATMWSEFVGPETIDSRIWPRTAAIAERLWSPSQVNDVQNMYERLDKVSLQLDGLGLTHIKNYEMMLRRLSNSFDVTALKNFVDVVEPLYTYSRDHPHVFKSYYPLTRVVDAARPDSKTARKFNTLVDQLVLEGAINDGKLSRIITWLNLWKNNHAQLLETIKVSPILKEIESLSEDLSKCAIVGLEALDYVKKGEFPNTEWIDIQLDILKKAETPRGESELVVIKSIEKLVRLTEK